MNACYHEGCDSACDRVRNGGVGSWQECRLMIARNAPSHAPSCRALQIAAPSAVCHCIPASSLLSRLCDSPFLPHPILLSSSRQQTRSTTNMLTYMYILYIYILRHASCCTQHGEQVHASRDHARLMHVSPHAGHASLFAMRRMWITARDTPPVPRASGPLGP